MNKMDGFFWPLVWRTSHTEATPDLYT